jgi:hypothetical protein
MTDSFRRIDYSLRPAKHAERRMLCDIFRRLAHFQPVEHYRYVGFGSVWFSDFVLFHRALGIRNMLSIEQAVRSRARFEANKPFAIEIDFRASSLVLPGLDYERPQFFWLDYDDPITLDMVNDVAAIARRASSGTVLVVSVQCVRPPDIAAAEREQLNDPNAIGPMQRFAARMSADGVDRVPGDLERGQLSNWAFGDLSRSIFYAEIDRILQDRRLSAPEGAVSYRSICDFEYEDGAKMTTLALVFHSEDDAAKVDACRFEDLEFLDPAGDAVFIPTPKITPREFRHLESQLPLAPGSELNIGHIPPGETTRFGDMYRYFPNFVSAEALG